MRLLFVSLTVCLLLGAGCARVPGADQAAPVQVDDSTPNAAEPTVSVVAPIAEYAKRRTFKVFGQYVHDRFTGYHTGDDIEYADVAGDVPVYAIMDGEVIKAQFVSGYGGFVLIDFGDVRAIYGHLDLSSVTVKPGDHVTAGQTIGILGDDHSAETDGERKHLHFAVYEGDEIRYQGYEAKQSSLANWLNPTDYLTSLGVSL